ncbi:MAG: hypothetical protein ACSHX0_13450 [Akkermansiaceae bacterium]
MKIYQSTILKLSSIFSFIFSICLAEVSGEVVQDAQLFPSNAHSYQQYGKTVAIGGLIIVVGSPFEEGVSEGIGGNPNLFRADDSGAVYIYNYANGQTNFEGYLKSSNSETYDTFGNALAISGNTLVVSAELEDSNATGVNGLQNNNSAGQSGAVYVFIKEGNTWTQQAYLKASNTQSSDIFGSSVAISGDTIVVGARGEDGGSIGINGDQSDNSSSSSGAAYVFVRNNGIWTQQAYLKASNTDSGDFFGCAVSISGETIAVGAYSEDGDGSNQSDNSGIDSGAVYLFKRINNSWYQQAYIKAGNADSGDQFGTSVSIFGDTLFVGAPYEASGATGINGDETDNSKPQAGAVYGFEREAEIWNDDVYIKMNQVNSSKFGSSINLSGDVVAVGAPKGSSGSISGSGVSIFYRNNRTWSHQVSIKRPSGVGGETGFGVSIGLSNGMALIGDAGFNLAPDGQSNILSGSAYLFSGIDPTEAPEIAIVNQDSFSISLNGSIEIVTLQGKPEQFFLTIRNLGTGTLSISSVSLSGTFESEFMLEPLAYPVTLIANQQASIPVTFLPVDVGNRQALLTISSNDFDESQYRVNLNGVSLSPTADTDGDGLSDYAEHLLSELGFDRTLRQDDLAATLFSGLENSNIDLNEIGYYRKEQLGAFRINSPLLEVDSVTGNFSATFRLDRSLDLVNWQPYPLRVNNFSILENGDGQILIEPESNVFIRLEVK